MHNNDSNVVWRGDGLARRRRAALELSVIGRRSAAAHRTS
jgi:hypothetical protein